MDDNGETIALIARDGTAIQTFAYNDEGAWPGRADGKGASLEYAGTFFADADFNSAENWRSSLEVHGSPGTIGSMPERSIVINEILTHTSLPYLDAVELRNLTSKPVDLSGWYLSNVVTPETVDSYKLFRIPDGTVVPADGWVVFDERDFNPNGAWNPAAGPPKPTEFSFDGFHDSEVWLLSSTTEGALRFGDHAEIGPGRLNESLGRSPDGTGRFDPMAQRTLFDESSPASPLPKLSSLNSQTRVGPLLIHEVHHSPIGDSPTLEFVEIHNPTATAVALNRWRLTFLPKALTHSDWASRAKVFLNFCCPKNPTRRKIAASKSLRSHEKYPCNPFQFFRPERLGWALFGHGGRDDGIPQCPTSIHQQIRSRTRCPHD